MTNFTDSIKVILKFSVILVSSTVFTIGMLMNHKYMTGISGGILISILIYRKFNQVRIQHMAFMSLPKELREQMLKGNTRIPIHKKEKEEEEYKGVYQ